MAHIEDRWEKTIDGGRVRTDRYGRGRRWRARYLDPDGHERNKTFARKADAERFLAGITSDVLRGAYVDPDAGKVTFGEFARQWLEAQTFGESTREATELRLRLHAEPHLGKRELRNIKPSLIQAWLRGLQQELAPTYVRAVFTNVSAVMNAAVDDGLIARNPSRARSVKPPKIDHRKIEPWPREQVEAVIAALPPRYRCLAVVAAGCGLRQGEALGLRVCDVDFLHQRLNVEQQVKIVRSKLTIGRPKGGRTREDNPISRAHFNRYVWQPALAAAGVEPGRANGMHALRHFYSSVLIDASESIKAVAEYLGHADPGFTLRVYAHLFPSSEDRARQAIDALFETGDHASDHPGDTGS